MYKIEKYNRNKLVEISEVKEGSVVKFVDRGSLILLGLNPRVATSLANKGFIFDDNVAYNLKATNGRCYGIINGVNITSDMVTLVAKITITE